MPWVVASRQLAAVMEPPLPLPEQLPRDLMLIYQLNVQSLLSFEVSPAETYNLNRIHNLCQESNLLCIMKLKIWRCFELTAILLSCISGQTDVFSPSCQKPDVSACSNALIVDKPCTDIIQIDPCLQPQSSFCSTSCDWVLPACLHTQHTELFPQEWQECNRTMMNSCIVLIATNISSTVGGNCPILPVNPRKVCQEPKPYDVQACQGFSDNTHILNLTVFEETVKYTCMICVDPIKPAETKLNATPPETLSDGTIDAKSAVKAMGNLRLLVDQMGNHSTADITMGEIKGILKVIPKKPEQVQFGFSSDKKVSIIDNGAAVAGRVSRTVSISKEALEIANNVSKNGRTFVGVFLFPSLSQDEKNSTLLNKEFIAIEMGPGIYNLKDPIILNYSNVNKGDAIVSCSSWNGTGNRPTWTKDGCTTSESGDTVTCRCYHLTFFAILMPLPDFIHSSNTHLRSVIVNP
ncbi:hypothetical protein AAFF_G00414900 [Aldrovandia affinis]|uniref:GAIN-B domain-containing protein n=1 Tax=Aldrovandia affinis TaxID=143900 RepID=A0AAD7SD34_9TELE|nr:hypothetical protein AAFF_G00414900 [Aldrovandia affinis]